MWQELSTYDITLLKKARLNLHFAIQPLASVADQLAVKEDDFSHTSLSYFPKLSSFLSAPLTSQGLRASLHLEDLELSLTSKDLQQLAKKKILDLRLEEIFIWLKDSLVAQSVDVQTLDFLSYPDFPESPLKNSAAFEIVKDDEYNYLEIFNTLYANTFFILSDFFEKKRIKTSIRIWPHHFDMAILINLEEKYHQREKASIGIGFSPGDTYYEEPYWYLSPWPYPEISALPSLPTSSHWHTDGFTASILTLTNLLNSSNQTTEIKNFIEESFTILGNLQSMP